jgi:hypothetical protein
MNSSDSRIRRFLFQYDLFPYRIDDLNGLIRITASGGVFALKEKKLDEEQRINLTRAYRLARSLTIDAVCPLPSKYGDLFLHDGESDCYLMPWIEETVPESDLTERYRRLFVKAGQLHRQTMKGKEDPAALFRTAGQLAGVRKAEWEQFLSGAEHHVYPSPFEQVVLNTAPGYLTPMEQSGVFFFGGPEKDEAGHITGLRRALCHGRLNPLHLLAAGEQSYLTNFENCHEDFFIIETAALFDQANVMLTADRGLWHSLIRSYVTACPLTDQEDAFLFHYLLTPAVPVDLFREYVTNHGKSELWFIRKWNRFTKARGNLLSCLSDYVNEKRRKKAAKEQGEKTGMKAD